MSTERDGDKFCIVCDNVRQGEHCQRATVWVTKNKIGEARQKAGIHRVRRSHGVVDLCRDHALESAPPVLVKQTPILTSTPWEGAE